MFTTIPKRQQAWAPQRVYLLLGIICLLGAITLTARAMLTVSDFGLSGDADVAVDAVGTLNLGTTSSTAVTIGKSGVPVTIPGSLAVTGGNVTIGVALPGGAAANSLGVGGCVYNPKIGLDVRCYGAKGDNSQDDAPAIQAAIDAAAAAGGGKIIFPDGTYSIGTTLNIATNAITLEGRGHTYNFTATGQKGPTLMARAGFAGPLVLIGNGSLTRYYGIRINGLNFDGNAGNATGYALHMRNAYEVFINHDDFKNFAGGVIVVSDNSDVITFDQVTAAYNAGEVSGYPSAELAVDSSEFIRVIDSEFSGTTGAMANAYFKTASNLLVTGTLFENGYNALVCQNCFYNNAFTGNQFIRARDHNVKLIANGGSNTSDTQFVNNVFADAGKDGAGGSYAGVYTDGVSNIGFVGNQFNNTVWAQAYGIYSTNASDTLKLSGDRFHGDTVANVSFAGTLSGNYWDEQTWITKGLTAQSAAAGAGTVLATFNNTDYTAGNRSAIKVRQQTGSGAGYSAYLGVDQATHNLFLSDDAIGTSMLYIDPAGNVGINKGGSANTAVCWMSDGKGIGHCTGAWSGTPPTCTCAQ